MQEIPCHLMITTLLCFFVLCNISLIIINNMNISATLDTSFTAILTVNVKNGSIFSNIKSQVNAVNCTTFTNSPIEINGLKVLIYFY